ncbi:MAG: lysoplasmalogenase [Vicinamibacteria bacterium]
MQVVALGVMGVVAAAIHVFAGDAVSVWDPWVKAVPVAMLGLVLVGSKRTLAANLAASGLFISALADAVIEYNFLGGLVGFLIAHVFYIAAFVRAEPRARWVRLIPMALWGLLTLPLLVASAGALALPVLIYGTVILTMVWRAAAAVDRVGWNAGTLGLAGALFFATSDTLLGYSRFVGPLPMARFLTLGTYWIAQSLITASFWKRSRT